MGYQSVSRTGKLGQNRLNLTYTTHCQRGRAADEYGASSRDSVRFRRMRRWLECVIRDQIIQLAVDMSERTRTLSSSFWGGCLNRVRSQYHPNWSPGLFGGETVTLWNCVVRMELQMPRTSRKAIGGTDQAIYAWRRQTEALLGTLTQQRRQLVSELQEIDDQINTFSRLLGARPAAPRPAPKAGRPRSTGGRQGGVTVGVLSALQGVDHLSPYEIAQKAGLRYRQVFACLMKLKARGRVKTVGRGAYCLTAKGAGVAPAPAAAPAAKASARGGLAKGSIAASILAALRGKDKMTKAQIVSATRLKPAQVQTSLAFLKRTKKVKGLSRGVFCLA